MPHGPVRATARVGFSGKLPSRGNFIRAGLLRALISAWGGRRWSRSKAASPLDKSVASLAPGGRLLACSDGLTKALPAPEFRVLAAADDAAGALVAAAVDRGARDNVTAVVLAIG